MQYNIDKKRDVQECQAALRKLKTKLKKLQTENERIKRIEYAKRTLYPKVSLNMNSNTKSNRYQQ